MKKSKEDKFGIISLVLGIISVLFMVIGFVFSFIGFFGFIFLILTFVFSGIQLKKNKNNLAVAGLILAFIALGFFLLDSVLTAQIAREKQQMAKEKQDASANQILNCDRPFFDENKTEFNCDETCKDVCEREGFDRYKAEVFMSSGNQCDCLCNGCRS
jgi:signal transduction histidine kinase